MKQYFVVPALLMLVAALCACPALAQKTVAVRGVCNDVEGKPIVGAVVEWLDAESGRKYDIKTNKKGEYYSLGIAPGHYKITLLQDNKELYYFSGVAVNLDENILDFDLKKEYAAAATQGTGSTPGQLKQQQEEEARVAKENATIRTLNEKLTAASAASQASDFDTAIRILNEAAQIDSSRDLIWARLGDAYRLSAAKQTDSAQRNGRFTAAITAYQKAVEIKKRIVESATPSKPEAGKQLAAYYNNLGEAYGRSGNVEGARNAYTQAARFDAAGAGLYYFNLGATLVNSGHNESAAIDAFKMVPASSPKFDAAQDQIEIIRGSPAFRSIGPYLRSPAFKSTLSNYIQSAKNQFRNLEGKELARLDDMSVSESTLILPGALNCTIQDSARDSRLTCPLATSHDKDQLRPEFKQLVSALKTALPNWNVFELDPEPEDGPGCRFGARNIEVWAAINLNPNKSYYALSLAVVVSGSAAK